MAMRARRIALLMLLLLLPIAVRGADDRSYREGVRAFEKRDYATAAAKMRQAIAVRSMEGIRREIGVNGASYYEYVPWYFLGAALQRMGDCAGAIPALKESERQGAVLKGAFARAFREARAACPDAPVSPPPQSPTVIEPPAENTATAAPPSHRKSEPGRGVAASPGRAEQRSQAKAAPVDLREVDAALARAETLIREAVTAGTPAEREQRALSEIVRRGREDRAILTAQGSRQLAASLNQQASVVEQLLRQSAEAVEPAPAVAPSRELREAANAFFAGDYAGCLARLAIQTTRDSRELQQTALFRAASEYALFLMSGEQDGDARRRSTEAVREVRRSGGRITMEAAFSPRFVNFFKSVR